MADAVCFVVDAQCVVVAFEVSKVLLSVTAGGLAGLHPVDGGRHRVALASTAVDGGVGGAEGWLWVGLDGAVEVDELLLNGLPGGDFLVVDSGNVGIHYSGGKKCSIQGSNLGPSVC